jgi:DASH complex subunit DAM1
LSALSASRSRLALDDYSQPALSHLAPVFAELSEAIEDLAVNFEGLDAINDGLDRFNEGFAGLLYGLRMNAYTSDILQVRYCLACPF